ncbi:MAG TPA: sigma factor-like helix-turn-helix DNA-binding protein [Candidatus Angelobacter sp.]|jgi:RNA polymerase sigma-70 factor, ECF subfamily
MSSSVSVINFGVIAAVENRTSNYDAIYGEHCHRIYSLAFWMTDNELAAEQLSTNTFLRAFALSAEPKTEQIDQALLAEIRELTTIGTLTLNSSVSAETKSVCGNVKRVHLERAVVELPATEKMIFLLHDVEGYTHEKIAYLLGLDVKESQFGLHQARLQLRKLISRMS